MKRTFQVVCCAFLGMVFQSAKAQSFSGLQNSNFAGVHSVYSNPALLTSMAYKRHANVTSMGFDVNTNLVSLTAPFTLWQAITGNVPAAYLNNKGKVQWSNDYLQSYPVGTQGWAQMGVEWRGPAYAKRIGQRTVWATHVRTRANVSMKNVSDATLAYAREFLDSGFKQAGGLQLLQTATSPLSLQANAYQEIGASLAYAIVDAKKLKVSAGVTAKYLMGLGHASVLSEGMQLQAYGRDSIVINHSMFDIAYSDSKLFQRLMQGVIIGGLPSLSEIMGNGFGMDLGVSVEGGKGGSVVQFKERWLGDPTVRNYQWRLAASLMDWGHVSYKNRLNTFHMSNANPVTLKMDSALMSAFAQGSTEGFAYLEQFARDNMNYSQGARTQRIAMPTQLLLQGDFRLMSRVYASFVWQQSLVSAQTMGFRQPSSLLVTPRIEMKWLEVAMPVGLTQDYRKGNIGAYVRVGPLFVGSDNFVSNLMLNNIKGVNMYLGLSTSIGKFKKH